jgi:23S rRNA (pseudouridine1915-N3)-methyltransferase
VRIAIVAVGRLGRTPEAELVRDYVARAGAAGRQLGLGPVEVIEVEPRKPGKMAEGEAILAALEHPLQTVLVACDERGETWSSRQMAERIGKWRDAGERRLALLIGGPDGHAPFILEEARLHLAFGAQTWPHALARVMLAEQIYRSMTILAGTPYHRD